MVASGLERVHLLGAAARIRERWLAGRAGGEDSAPAPDGLPMPPARLRLLVSGRSADRSEYLRLGEQMADSIRLAVDADEPAMGDLGALLDFGCGSGRVIRHWGDLDGTEIHGCDYNPDLVEWCAANLPFMTATLNRLAPPTPYADESFDLVYALSVFSHLSADLQHAWVAEMRRILKPGGRLIVSVLGEAMVGRLRAGRQAEFHRGRLVVERPRMAGNNACTVYHPRTYVTGELLSEFSSVTEFDLGSAAVPVLQQGYIARL